MEKKILICTPDGNQKIETITCDPDPVMPDPMDPLTITQLAVAELAQTVENNNTATQLAIAELAEALLGGAT